VSTPFVRHAASGGRERGCPVRQALDVCVLFAKRQKKEKENGNKPSTFINQPSFNSSINPSNQS